jgi:prevent-host-death family protein
MISAISAGEVRQNFSEILNEAVYGRKKIFITRFGKPEAVLLGLRDLNPKDWVSKKEWQTGFKIFSKIRVSGRDLMEEEAGELVEEAVRSVRSKRV